MQIHLYITIWWRRAAFLLVLLLPIVESYGHAEAMGIK
jgi:hypothetical protein